MAASSLAAPLADRLVAACAAAVPVTGVGLILMTDDGPAGVVAASDDAAATMEQLQFSLGEGPCVDSSVTGRPALHPELARTGPHRWPLFSSAALQAGIGAIYALPLRVGAIRLGVLDLYRDKPGHLTDDQLAEALSFADVATTILLHGETRSPPPGGAERDWLDDVIGHRRVVHQATGFLAVQARIGLAEALALLRAKSFSAGRSIEEVARDVVDGTLRLNDDDA
ncbi:MAG: GAF domain-containing protein [Actinomycetales bacterium]